MLFIYTYYNKKREVTCNRLLTTEGPPHVRTFGPTEKGPEIKLLNCNYVYHNISVLNIDKIC